MRNAVIVCLLGAVSTLCFAGFTISGMVRDPGGNPVEYQYVTLRQDDPYFEVTVRADAFGLFSFNNISAGETILFVKGHLLPAGLASFRHMMEVNSNVSGLNLQLTPEAVIEGWVVDKDTAEPIGGAWVSAWQSPMNFYVATDASGFFRLSHLPAGSIEVSANAEAYGYAKKEHNVILQAEEHREDVLIALSKGALLTCTFKDPYGNPVPKDYDIYLDGLDFYDLRTDTLGKVSGLVAPGNYRIASDDDNEPWKSNGRIITISDTAPVDLGTIVLYNDATGGTLSGTVSNPQNTPNQGIHWIFAVEPGLVMTPENNYYTVETPRRSWASGNPGPYAVTALAPGRYDLYFSVGYQEELIEHEVERMWVSLRDVRTNVLTGTGNLNFTYSGQGGSVQGRVYSPTGDVLPEFKVFLTDSAGKVVALTELEGQYDTYEIHHIKPGTYTPAATTCEFGVTRGSPIVVVEGKTTVINDIYMLPGGQKYGPDLDGDGYVNLADMVELSEQWLKTGSNAADFDRSGRVSLSDVVPLARFWQGHQLVYPN